MKTVYIFLAEGFEEIEAVTPMDLLRRVGVDVKFVSVTGSLQVTGAHGIAYMADLLFEALPETTDAAIILPGGMPGTNHLLAHKGLCNLIHKLHGAQAPIAAICAAPLILGELGILRHRHATIYPGMESRLVGATPIADDVCVDGHIITSRGPGTAIPFSLYLAELFAGSQAAETLKADIVYQR